MKKIICILALLIFSVLNANAQTNDFGPLLDDDIIVSNIDENGEGDIKNWPVDIVFNDEQYLVVWAGNPSSTKADCGSWSCADIFGRLISPSGEYITEFFKISSDRTKAQLWPSVASNGTTFLVVWVDDITNLVKGQMVTRTGDLLGREIIISPTEFEACYCGLDVASDGTDYMVVFAETTVDVDIYGQRVKGNGTIDGPPFAIADGTDWEWNPSIVYGAGKYFVVWERKIDPSAEEECDIYGALIDAVSGNLQSFPVADGPSAQCSSEDCDYVTHPTSMSFDGTNFITAWHDSADDGVHAARVSPNGQLLDGPGGIPVSSGQAGVHPQVAFDDSNWLVVWRGMNYPHYTYGARITTDGTVLDLDSLNLIPDGSCPAVASDGTNFMVTWDSGFTAHQKAQLFGSGIPRASADIPFLSPVGYPVSMNAAYSLSPSGAPLTYHWDFGDNSTQTTTESVVLHTYSSVGSYPVSLFVNDGENNSKPFEMTAMISINAGGGQNRTVDDFLSYINPETKSNTLPAGTTTYDIHIVYGPTIDPSTFQANLNGTSLNIFNPVAGTAEVVTISGLSPGRNTLKLSVEGIKLPAQIAKDQDTLVFKVE
jgi:hypothetical protein